MSRWLDHRKMNRVTFKVDDIELQIIKDLAEALEINESEAIRRCLWAFRVLYDNGLKVEDAIVLPAAAGISLGEALKPIPELANHLGIEIKAWRKRVANQEPPQKP